ncbi:MAG: hypothetical protein Q9166_005740 [cf. Caloplaca sp. 2 TL-2023]
MSSLGRRRGLPDLPNELLRDIADDLTCSDLKSLRIVCSRLQDFATPLIFTTVICAARRGVLDAFKALSNHPQLCQYVTKLVYDSSWFEHDMVEQYEEIAKNSEKSDTSTTTEGREKYIQGYKEQEHILASELAPALGLAIKNFSNLRRVDYADLSRLPCFRWDRVEDLGPDFRLGDLTFSPVKNEASIHYPLIPHLFKDTSLRCRYFGLARLLEDLCQEGLKVHIDDLRLGDSTYSRDSGGIPDILFMALTEGSFGSLTAFESLRNLDITFSYCTRAHHAYAFTRFCQLELLRLVGPICAPNDDSKFAPAIRQPVVRFPGHDVHATWPKLRALELKWVVSSTADFLAFLDRHRNTLQFANIYQCYLDGKDTWCTLVSSLRSMYPNLIVEPYQRCYYYMTHHYDTRIINFTLYGGQAALVNMGIPSGTDTNVDNYDEDEVSNFHNDEESLPEEERYSSEELDYSEDGDTSETEGCPVQHKSNCQCNTNHWELGIEGLKSCNSATADSTQTNTTSNDT